MNKAAEVAETQAMLERVEEQFGLKPRRLVGDTNYGSAAMLGWLVDDKGIEPHVPVWEKWKRHDGTFEISEFPYDSSTDTYTCPGGRLLKRKRYKPRNGGTGITKANTLIYRARVPECTSCLLKARCCPNTPARKIARSVFEHARDVARDIVKTDAYQQSRKDRKKVEALFAHMKRILRMDRLRLRGLTGAKDEFLLTATVQNLRRMAKYLSTGPPGSLTSAVR